jgi:aldehyde:ferredoxin oxidoreductase
MAWHGKVLRVDLTRERSREEPLNQEWAARFLGQRGLGTRYLAAEVDPWVDPLSPDNKLLIAAGPLTGTMASTGGRWSVITKGALTGAVACSNSGGRFGAELRMAGWDLVIFEGRATRPVYLYIRDREVKILPAEDFIWGATVWDTEERLRVRHQEPALRIASIGRAGEAGVRYACVVNDRDRAAGRSGVGAVMGSKNLKAIAVRGSVGVPMPDMGRFMSVATAAREMLNSAPGRARLARFGTSAMMDVTQAYGALPTRNAREVQFAGAARVNAKAMRARRSSDGSTNLVRNKACFACTIGCGRLAHIDPEHFSVQGDQGHYRGVEGGLEYETAYATGPMVGVDDIDACHFANLLCNEHGMDPISFGATLAAAMELYELGIISGAETGGVELRFGSAEALVWAARATGTAEGFGSELGLGAKRLCEKYQRPELAMVVKGQEFPGYDPRAMQGMGLAYATSNRGACHLRADPFEDDFQRVTPEGKADIVRRSQDAIAAIDSSGLCAFTTTAWGLGEFAAQIEAALGDDWTEQRLRETGERIWNLERQFNLKAGFTAADDTLPPRMLADAAGSGAAKGRVTELAHMLPEYYRLRGWDQAGVPSTETLTRLGLHV